MILNAFDYITTVTAYDNRGRVTSVATKNPTLEVTEIQTHTLDFTGRITKTVTLHKKTGKNDVTLTDEFSYDAVGRLLTHDQTLTQGTTTVTQTVAAHCYDDLGQLARKSLGVKLQTLDYAYNMRGWMTAINDTQDLGSDLFAFKLDYLANGNISGTRWKNTENTALQSYTYSYDGLNRILSATSGDGNYNVSGITYDLNGNIKTLQRAGYTGGDTYGSIDNLDYTYYGNTNRLKSVSDAADTAYGFKAANATYTYDTNGNMITDTGKGVNNIIYNHLNLPTIVSTSQGTLNYTYDASGVKLQKTVGSDVTQYAGAFLYKNGTLEMIHMPEGYIEHDNGVFKYVYRITDHLGNARVSFKDSDGNGSIDPDNEVIETNSYYPFGLEQQKPNTTIGSTNLGQKFKYNGKEFEDDLDYNMYDYDLRHYDPAIGRWVVIDPLAEQMRRHSPYNYAFDNPIYFIDPDGMAPFDWYKRIDEQTNTTYYFYDSSIDSEEAFNAAGLCEEGYEYVGHAGSEIDSFNGTQVTLKSDGSFEVTDRRENDVVTTDDSEGGYSGIGRTPHTVVETESANPGTKWSDNETYYFQNMDNTVDKDSYDNLSKGQKTFLANNCENCNAAAEGMSQAPGSGAGRIFDLVKSVSHNPHVPSEKLHIDRFKSGRTPKKTILQHLNTKENRNFAKDLIKHIFRKKK